MFAKPMRQYDTVGAFGMSDAASRVTVQILGQQSEARGPVTHHLSLLWDGTGFSLRCIVAATLAPDEIIVDGIVPLDLVDAMVIYAELHQPGVSPVAGEEALSRRVARRTRTPAREAAA